MICYSVRGTCKVLNWLLVLGAGCGVRACGLATGTESSYENFDYLIRDTYNGVYYDMR
jgi:hypothetical protein